MRLLVDLVREYQQANHLAKRLCVGDEIFILVGPPMRDHVVRRCRCPAELVDDAYSDTMLGILKSLDSCNCESDSQCWSWCYTIATNKVKNLFRAGRSPRAEGMDVDQLEQALAAADLVVPATAGDKADYDYILKLVRNSKPPCYDYLLDFSLGWDYTTIAEKYGAPTGEAMWKRIKRCVELARELLDERP